ncbi:MAG: tetratricopeptide repeat protein [Ginsengibacter sp.]
MKPFTLFSRLKFVHFSLVLFLLSFFLYVNTVHNEYALDDDMVISYNEYVQQGVSGIPQILSTDIYESFYRQNNAQQQLSGGRYRPLSLVTFAIDKQLFGDDPGAKHLVNALLYALSIVVFFFCFRRSLRLSLAVSFFSTLLFAIHPIHTEVVANIKSRDEILSLLFYVLTIIYFLQWKDTGRKVFLLAMLGVFFLALLSKEYSVTLFVILPAVAFIFRGKNILQSLTPAIWLLLPFTVYALLRYKVVGIGSVTQIDPLNDPYLFASGIERTATSFYIILKYLGLLLFPVSLSADYSFSQISYRSFSDPGVLLSIIIHSALIAGTIYGLYKRKKIAIACLIYLLNLALVSNFIFSIGATMGERLIYHSSLGFCLAVGLLFEPIFQKKTYRIKAAMAAVIVMLLAFSMYIIIPRNNDWKNSDTLFIHDVDVVPNSVLANSNAAHGYIFMALEAKDGNEKRTLFEKAGGYASKALKLHPAFTNAHINYGLILFYLGQYDSCIAHWKRAYALLPSSPQVKADAQFLYDKGLEAALRHHTDTAIYFIKGATEVTPLNPVYWTNLGGAYYTNHRFEEARQCWERTLQLDANDDNAKRGLRALP